MARSRLARLARQAASLHTIFILIATVFGGYFYLDAHFARAADVRQLSTEFKIYQLEQAFRELDRERFQWENKRQSVGVNPIEAQRLRDIQREMVAIQQRLRQLRGGP